MESSIERSFVLHSKSSLVNVELKLTWTIKDFLSLRDKTTSYFSKSFPLKELGFVEATEQWRLRVNPNFPYAGKGQNDENYVGLFLDIADVQQPLPVRFALTINHPVSGITKIVAGPWTKLFGTDSQSKTNWGEQKAIAHTELFADQPGYLCDGALVVKAEIQFPVERDLSLVTASPMVNVHRAALCSQFAKLYLSQEFTDFVLVSSDKVKFAVHRCVLAARSPVFAAMIKHGQVEGETGHCHIPDVDGATLNILLTYLYSGCTEDVSKMPNKILEAADKYEIVRLRDVAVECLLQTISMENALELLNIADRRKLDKLAKLSARFIAENLGAFRQQEEFRMLTQQSNLTEYLFETLAGKDW